MDQHLAQVVASLRKTIDVASSASLDDGAMRALHRALALLWSAHDEIEALQTLSRRHA